jgi:hypothetical protein
LSATKNLKFWSTLTESNSREQVYRRIALLYRTPVRPILNAAHDNTIHALCHLELPVSLDQDAVCASGLGDGKTGGSFLVEGTKWRPLTRRIQQETRLH